MKRLLAIAYLLCACTCNRTDSGPAHVASNAEPAKPPPGQACAVDHVIGHQAVCARYEGAGWACLNSKRNVLNAEPSLWTKPGQEQWQGWPDRYERLWLGYHQACGQLADGTVECSGPDYARVTVRTATGRFRPTILPNNPVALNIEYKALWAAHGAVYAAPDKFRIPFSEGLTHVQPSYNVNCAWNTQRILCWGPLHWLFADEDPSNREHTQRYMKEMLPIEIDGIDEPIEKAVVGYSGCALTQPGHVYCWGEAWTRGDGPRPPCTDKRCPHDMRLATRVPIDGVVDVAIGTRGVFALKADGSVWRWGYGLALKKERERPFFDRPTEWKELGKDNRRLLGRDDHACVVKSDNSLMCWGLLKVGSEGGFSTTVDCNVYDNCPPTEMLPACVTRH